MLAYGSHGCDVVVKAVLSTGDAYVGPITGVAPGPAAGSCSYQVCLECICTSHCRWGQESLGFAMPVQAVWARRPYILESQLFQPPSELSTAEWQCIARGPRAISLLGAAFTTNRPVCGVCCPFPYLINQARSRAYEHCSSWLTSILDKHERN